MCHGSNRGFLDLAERGLVTCGSVMVPCPWFPQIAAAAAADLALDLGVHLTLIEVVEPGYRKVIEELPAGVTHFTLYCTVSGDVEAITPQHAPWRTNEYVFFASDAVAEWCAALDVVPIGYRRIQQLWSKLDS